MKKLLIYVAIGMAVALVAISLAYSFIFTYTTQIPVYVNITNDYPYRIINSTTIEFINIYNSPAVVIYGNETCYVQPGQIVYLKVMKSVDIIVVKFPEDPNVMITYYLQDSGE
ncbi:MAG: hypothetical protein OWQ54_05935 [Sulfolobaceae archaeon]|nr:hypothetical protein [Sulfolobaceae archaeon]